ncbi:MAG: Uma2 family endonuclease [Tychonema bourrellyi B0820]|uniref:Uma2 family endonuclease n=1 Tax=Tychonema bourrellyi FEM_GT703 TaxID=2040638 RepID=A0A2G4F5U4_9CYAN|nr:Uma2 family endonuclease [Tychonema bourrellyi]MDQ2099681.1 Uma2 family endonuclease [Tychonema bourrellyi B0820]PHX57163.1 Uma2 family endonuclease [Tychonema bourrellyi FEM_GT703]
MTATIILPKNTDQKSEYESQPKFENTAEIQPESDTEKVISLEDFLVRPPDRMEWVDGNLVEKTGMTFKHGLAQVNLATSWKNYKNSSGHGGEVVTEVLCRTAKQGRRPDVAYITPELLQQQAGNFTTLSQSFPLIAEVASPDDSGEELFAKAQEYLASGCLEVWLLFPEARLIFVNAGNNWLLFNADEVVNTQRVLTGFSVAVNELLA